MTATSRPRTMMVPVTPQLMAELEATGHALDNLVREANGSRGGVLNDRAHYATVVDTLEALTIATLSATSSVPLSNRKDVKPGARFDMGAGTPLAHHVNASVAYLQGTASGLLAANDFSQYKGDQVDQAHGILKQLYGLLLNGVIRQAEADLEQVKKKGAGQLLRTATYLAARASAPASDDRPVFDAREASISNPAPVLRSVD